MIDNTVIAKTYQGIFSQVGVFWTVTLDHWNLYIH